MAAIDPVKAKEKQTVQGTCDDVNTHMENHGVTDVTGKAHRGYTGWTHAEISFTYQYEYSKTTKTIIYCNCNKTYYDDVQKCLQECRAGLGCFTGICEPVSDEVCLETTKFSASFNAAITVSVLDWEPSSPLSVACKAEKRRWERAVEQHERKHVQDIRKVVRDQGQNAKNRKYFACGSSEEEAEGKLKEQIEKDLQKNIASINDKITTMSNEFHASPAGQPITLDCNRCS